jgi:hypothetical protein
MTVTVNGKKVASHSESHGRYENFRKGIAKKMSSKKDPMAGIPLSKPTFAKYKKPSER